jgi:hypothetical protein
MTSINAVLNETISKLCLDPNIKTEDLTYLISECARIIEYRKNEEFYYNNQPVNEVSTSVSTSASTVDEEKTVKIEEEFPIMESPTTVNVKPSFKEILKKDLPPSNVDTSSAIVSSNSVTSTNSSRNSEQQYFITGIDRFYDEESISLMEKNSQMINAGVKNGVEDGIKFIISKNKLITNLDDFIKSLLNNDVPLWKIKFYLYISNKEYDLTSSTSVEDAEHNVKAIEIFNDYSIPNGMKDYFEGTVIDKLTGAETYVYIKDHKYNKYIDYYFNKTIEYNKGVYTCKKDTIVLIFRNRFLHLINKKN